ncbi:MAG: low specificity L-threonine aldolase [Opitutales bacterium]|jgi:threonine aldolase
MTRDIFGDAPVRERNFASDNNAGSCPEVLAILEEANKGHAPGYGDDVWTQRAAAGVRELFEVECEVFFVFNGTAANSLALATLCRSYHGILCHDMSHVETDECGAPEFFGGGTKVIPLPGEDGRLSAESIEEAALRRNDVHFPKIKALSLTQATELGTVYEVDHLAAIGESAKRCGLSIHLDGARLANAVAQLGVSPKELIEASSADVLCFGSTKNGSPVGDAVVFFNRGLAAEFEYRRKQAGQLASKMRYLAAPWVALMENDLWLRNARHANSMAECLRREIEQISEVKVRFPRQANSVFVDIPEKAQAALREKGWLFYVFLGKTVCRLMCSWDLTNDDVAEFATDLREALEQE